MSNTNLNKKSRQLRRFDRELGLHQQDGFQLKFMEDQCLDLLECLDGLVANTSERVPNAVGGYELLRNTLGGHENDEHKMERAIWKAWKPEGALCGTEFASACTAIPFYQVRIQRPGQKKFNACWGRVDLVGVDDATHLPVLTELKKGSADDTLLRVLIEVAAYGLALRKSWKEVLRNEWCEALRTLEIKAEAPAEWEKCRLICAAPKRFWKRQLGLLGPGGVIRASAWKPFFALVDAFGRHGLTFEFVSVDFKGCDRSRDFTDLDEDGLPIATGAKPLPLRDFVGFMTD